jgi:hypothetical protein
LVKVEVRESRGVEARSWVSRKISRLWARGVKVIVEFSSDPRVKVVGF